MIIDFEDKKKNNEEFKQFYKEHIVPKIGKIEEKRKIAQKYNKCIVILSYFVGVIPFAIYHFFINPIDIFVFFFMGCLFIPYLLITSWSYYIYKKITQPFKNIVLQQIFLRTKQNIQHSKSNYRDKKQKKKIQIFKDVGLVPETLLDSIYIDDQIRIKNDENIINIYETAITKKKLSKKEKILFQGLLISIKTEEDFDQHTIITPVYKKGFKNNIAYKNRINIKNNKLHKINLENAAFLEKFSVFSNNEIQSRNLLTPSFMEKIENFNKNKSQNFVSEKNMTQMPYIIHKLNIMETKKPDLDNNISHHTSFVFKGDTIYIAIHSHHNFFEIGKNINISYNNATHGEILFNNLLLIKECMNLAQKKQLKS